MDRIHLDLTQLLGFKLIAKSGAVVTAKVGGKPDMTPGDAVSSAITAKVGGKPDIVREEWAIIGAKIGGKPG